MLCFVSPVFFTGSTIWRLSRRISKTTSESCPIHSSRLRCTKRFVLLPVACCLFVSSFLSFLSCVISSPGTRRSNSLLTRQFTPDSPILSFHARFSSFPLSSVLRDLDKKRTTFENLIKQLPKPHYDTLRFFALHLHHLTFNEENKMSARTFGTVFGRKSARDRLVTERSNPARKKKRMNAKLMCLVFSSSLFWLLVSADPLP